MYHYIPVSRPNESAWATAIWLGVYDSKRKKMHGDWVVCNGILYEKRLRQLKMVHIGRPEIDPGPASEPPPDLGNRSP